MNTMNGFSFIIKMVLVVTFAITIPQGADAQRSARKARKHDKLDKRIAQVENNGKMTNRLEKRDKKLHRAERRAIRDGIITPNEQREVNRKYRRTKRSTRRAERG